METRQIRSALISVYHKEGLDPIIRLLDQQNVAIYSTGGTRRHIEESGVEVRSVEGLTSYPSILDGRVKTLHPKVFGGILARREEDHIAQLVEYDIPQIDLVIVDLYPFEQTLRETEDDGEIIEKIDIGGISLIRAAAKNYRDVLVVSRREEYAGLLKILEAGGATDLSTRQWFAARAFAVSSHYDSLIFQYFNRNAGLPALRVSAGDPVSLRYGENPHQEGSFYGDMDAVWTQLNGKALSFNNLVDIDAALRLMREFRDGEPAFAVLKHTNSCGLAVRPTVSEAWEAALAGDPISAFGGILISNREIDLATAEMIDKIFYEVLIAPGYAEEALERLRKKKKRIVLKLKSRDLSDRQLKTCVNGYLEQPMDHRTEAEADLEVVTKASPSNGQVQDLLFANIAVKHLKSNAIALAKDRQLLGIGCGQTSRVDALKQAIAKARAFDLSLEGAVMASDAFFPFPDCVEIADEAGISAVIQPGGSIKDQESVDYCDAHGMSMVLTGTRHFKH